MRNVRIEGTRFLNSTWNHNNQLLQGTITIFQYNPDVFSTQPYNENIVIRDNLFSGIDDAPDVSAIHVANAQDVEIVGNRFERVTNPVTVDSASTASIHIQDIKPAASGND